MARVDGRIKLIDQRWHGGLSSVSHDSTLTGTGTPSYPLSVVSAGLSKETPSGTVNDSNVTFTVTHQPFFINVNGGIYEVGTGLYASYVAGTITLTSPVGSGGFIRSYFA